MSKVIFLKHPLKFIFTVMLGCICLFPPGMLLLRRNGS
jgi:hypothetical protein